MLMGDQLVARNISDRKAIYSGEILPSPLK